MALYLTDAELDALAERARKVLNAPTKQDAVRQALEKVVEECPQDENAPVSEKTTRAERLHVIRQKYQSLGNLNPDFDEKKFLDEMWEN